MDAEQIEEMPPIYFPNKRETAKYVYDYNLLTVKQVELAKEVGEFRLLQQLKEPSSFKEVSQSRAAEWIFMCLSYLLCPIKDGNPIKWNDGLIGSIESYICDLPAKELTRMEAVVTHFFTRTGKSELILTNLQGRGSSKLRERRLEQVLMSALTNYSETQKLKENTKSKIATKKAN